MLDLKNWKNNIINFIDKYVFKYKTSLLDRCINTIIFIFQLVFVLSITLIYVLACAKSIKPYSKYFLDFELTQSIIMLNYICLILFPIFFKTKSKILNILIIIFSTFVIFCDTNSLVFLGNDANSTFLINLFDFEFVKTAFMIQTKLCILATFFVLTVLCGLCILNKRLELHNKKLRILIIFVTFIILILPFGFFYRFFKKNNFLYALDNSRYKIYSYDELFQMVKNQEYIDNSKLIASIEGKQKNIVFIFLESFEESYLFNSKLRKYTPFLNSLTKNSEFYHNIDQLSYSDYTTSAIFTVMCGIRFNLYTKITDFSQILNTDKLVCLPHILNKIGYKQVYVGGANKTLFNKDTMLRMLKYDVIEDNVSILKKYPSFDNDKWGIYDTDMFEVAKEHFLELSKSNQPFNLTILTTATHNDDGYVSSKCKTSESNKINLSKGIECTDYLVFDFIEFLKKQPNYKDTIVVIMPDHVQYNYNTLNKIIDKEEKKLYTIILNSDKKAIFNKKILYTDLAELFLQKLNIKHNVIFFNSYLNENYNKKLELVNDNSAIERVFLYKLFNGE